MEAEIKALFDEQMRTFESFKASNDALQKQVKDLGSADAVTQAEVQKLSAALDRIAEDIKAAQKRQDELEAKANRPRIEHGDAERKEAEHLAAFNLQNRLGAQLKGRPAPAEISLDEYRAYKQAVVEYYRRGDNSPLLTAEQQKAMRVGLDPDGGYLVAPDMGGRIVSRVFESSPIRPIASVVTISTDALEGVNDVNEADAGWVGEEASRAETTTPQVGMWRIPVFTMYAKPKATQQLLDDAAVDIEAWLAGKVADKLARLEATAFVSGAGVKTPRGFMAYAAASVTTADATRSWGVLQHVVTGGATGFPVLSSGASNPNALITIQYELKPQFRQNARWVMSRRSVAEVRKLKDADGHYFWSPGLQPGQPSMLLNFPVTEAEDMPAFGAGLYPIAFGDFREGYQIVDRQGIRTLRDPYTDKPFVLFYTTRRVGGDVLNFEAIKLLKCST